MKRIDVIYGDRDYSTSGRDVEDLRNQIVAKSNGTDPNPWLEVNVGLGEPQTTYLLIGSACQIALVPVPEDDSAAQPFESDDVHGQ